ncbi:hypothetical protein BS47DRAFT_1367313 [Hydnum rufescens UP504]|uniref:Uncharacterized protein n=1 Tax=Hydnum rufescens UP504 TaxID=1448309 RepID=A0A9P6DPP4_9AGAM|nr:hypothetical protein BS47DRAFT_1367313 [Hydnum rufescens UP504]
MSMLSQGHYSTPALSGIERVPNFIWDLASGELKLSLMGHISTPIIGCYFDPGKCQQTQCTKTEGENRITHPLQQVIISHLNNDLCETRGDPGKINAKPDPMQEFAYKIWYHTPTTVDPPSCAKTHPMRLRTRPPTKMSICAPTQDRTQEPSPQTSGIYAMRDLEPHMNPQHQTHDLKPCKPKPHKPKPMTMTPNPLSETKPHEQNHECLSTTHPLRWVCGTVGDKIASPWTGTHMNP